MTSQTTSSAVRIYKTGVICKDDSKPYFFLTLLEVLQFLFLLKERNKTYSDDKINVGRWFRCRRIRGIF
jgi:hypothetical protein